VLEHALRAEINGRTPSRRRFGQDGAEYDDEHDDGEEASGSDEDATPRRKGLGSRLGGLFRRARLSTSRRHSDELVSSEGQV
jgi:hypothetical protein